MLEKAGDPYNKKDKNPKLKTEKYLYNIHCLRRFWITELPADRMNPEAVNYIGGHMSLLDRDYKNFEAERWRRLFKEDYDKHMGCLNIFESIPNLTNINKEISQLQKENEELDQKTNGLRLGLLETKHELGKALQLIQELKKKK